MLCVRFEPPPMCETLLPQLLGLLGEFTPVVQALPPAGALLAPHDGVRGSGDGVRGSGRGAEELAAAIRARALSRHGVDCAVGIGPGPALARLALDEAAPGAICVLPEHPDALAELLASHSVTALPGATDATARLLGRHGLDTLGRIAAAPPSVLCRLLGTETGRDLHDKASGVDRGRVVPNPLPARRLTADHPAETRSRTLREPTAHSPALTRAAHGMYEALTPQPARVHGLALHAEELVSAELRPRGSGAQYHSNRTPLKVFTDA